VTLNERLRRAPPAREKPERAFYPDSSAAKEAAKPAVNGAAMAGSTTVNDKVNSAVAAAYEVVEDNVREGRLAAARLRTAGHLTAETSPDVKAVAGRLMHMTKEIGSTWVDLFSAVLREPEVRALVDKLTSHDRPSKEPTPSGSGLTTLAVTQRLSSRKPIEVTLSALGTGAIVGVPRIGGLHALDGSPAIQQAGFKVRDGGGLELRISVPDDQPAGDYAGVILDEGGQNAIGALTVRVLDG
jgi:hypothetical protein